MGLVGLVSWWLGCCFGYFIGWSDGLSFLGMGRGLIYCCCCLLGGCLCRGVWLLIVCLGSLRRVCCWFGWFCWWVGIGCCLSFVLKVFGWGWIRVFCWFWFLVLCYWLFLWWRGFCVGCFGLFCFLKLIFDLKLMGFGCSVWC